MSAGHQLKVTKQEKFKWRRVLEVFEDGSVWILSGKYPPQLFRPGSAVFIIPTVTILWYQLLESVECH